MSNDTSLDLVKQAPVVTCPGCNIPMTLRTLEPVTTSTDLYTATFHCDRCHTDTKRELKAHAMKK